jgi:hypothetical protein
MADPDLTLKLRRREGVICREVPDRAFLLDKNSGRCFELNRMAAAVWARLDGSSTVEEVCRRLHADLPTGIALERLKGDVGRLVVDLKRSGLAVEQP